VVRRGIEESSCAFKHIKVNPVPGGERKTRDSGRNQLRLTLVSEVFR
jgi:hypothetical protein